MPTKLAPAIAYSGLLHSFMPEIIIIGCLVMDNFPCKKFSAVRTSSSKHFPQNTESNTGSEKKYEKQGIGTHYIPPRSR